MVNETSIHSIENFVRLLVLTFLSSAIIACGGGGGGGGGSGSSGGGGSGNPPAVCTGTGTAIANPAIYLATLDGVPPTELYLVDADNPGAGSIRLNAPLSPAQSIDSFALSPDNRCVVYIADEGTAGRFELYSVDIANPGVVARLNPELPAGRDVTDFSFSADGGQLLYRADQDNDNVNELYLVDIDDPGVSAKVNGSLVSNGDVAAVDFAFSPDGSQILYVADQRLDNEFELFLVEKSAPGVSALVNPPFATFVELKTGAKFSPDGNWVGYTADQDNDEITELYVVGVQNLGTSIKLNPIYVGDADLCSFEFSPDSLQVVYCADQDTVDTLELYSVAIATPGASVKLNAPLVADGDVTTDFSFGSDSSFVIYRADQDTDETRELYRVLIANPGVADKLNGVLPANGDVFSFDIRMDDLAVIYDADQVTNAVREIYQVELATPGTSIKLNPPLAGSVTMPPQFSADGEEVVYIADQSVAGRTELYSLDITLPPPLTSIRLNAALVAGGNVSGFVIPQ